MTNRIFLFIESLNITPTEFADKIGVSRAAISSIKTGRTQPTLSLVEKIKQHYPNIDINWLIFGEGEASIVNNEEINSGDDIVELVEDNKSPDDNNIANDYTAVYIAEQPKIQPEKEVQDVHLERSVKKVILLYSDGSFEEFNR